VKVKLWIAIIGFGFCVAAALTNLPSQDTLSIISADNVDKFLFDFLVTFIKSPFSWIGIGLLIIAFRSSPAHHRRVGGSDDEPSLYKE